MGNQVRNGRNYKDNIIKLSINSFSTNSGIHENLSLYNDKKFRNKNDFHQIEEKYFSEVLPLEKINKNIKKGVLNSKHNIIENTKFNSRNNINSLKNKIIFLSSYSMKQNINSNENISSKLNIKNSNKNIIPFNSKNSVSNDNMKKIINNRKNTNLNKELLSDILKKLKKENIKNNINIEQKKKLLNLKEIDSIPNDKDNNSSINSSKFINFDIINEKESIIEELEITNRTNNKNYLNFKNCLNLDNNNHIQTKESLHEMEFEDYIKKLNLEEVNIDKELNERPLFYKRNRNIVSFNISQNKLKNYLTTNNTSNNFSYNKIKQKNFINNNIASFKRFSLRNNLNKNNKKENKEKFLKSVKIDSKKQNNKLINKNNNIKAFNINSFTKSRRVLELKSKKEILTTPNSYSNLLIPNNLYIGNNTHENSSISKEKKNSKIKGNIHKDYFNFKKLIIKKFHNINKFINSDFLISSKEKGSNLNSQRNYQKSANISFKKIKSDNSSKIESPKIRSSKKLYKKGRNEILDRYLKSNFHSANLSKKKYIYMSGNSSENNLSNNNIINEEINNKNCKIVRIFKINNNIKNKNNSSKKFRNNQNKFHLKNYDYKFKYPINKIKNNIFFSKRSSSSNNIFENNNKTNERKIIEIKPIINTNISPSIKKRKNSPRKYKKK